MKFYLIQCIFTFWIMEFPNFIMENHLIKMKQTRMTDPSAKTESNFLNNGYYQMKTNFRIIRMNEIPLQFPYGSFSVTKNSFSFGINKCAIQRVH